MDSLGMLGGYFDPLLQPRYQPFSGGSIPPQPEPMMQQQGGQWQPYRPPDAAEANRQLYGMTGIPDMQQAYQAYQRGEYLPAFGQGAWGALQAGSLAAPGIGAAARLGRAAAPNALSTLGAMLADESGALKLPDLWHGAARRWAAEPGAPLGRPNPKMIGTGEGALTEGQGLYGSDARRVGQWYRNAYGDPNELTGNQKYPGALYRLNYPGAEVDQFLAWDKPLAEQPARIQAALRDPNLHGGLPFEPGTPGEEIYRTLARRHGGENPLRQALDERGILGTSIPADEWMARGATNYTILSPERLNVLKRYGILGPLAGVTAGSQY